MADKKSSSQEDFSSIHSKLRDSMSGINRFQDFSSINSKLRINRFQDFSSIHSKLRDSMSGINRFQDFSSINSKLRDSMSGINRFQDFSSIGSLGVNQKTINSDSLFANKNEKKLEKRNDDLIKKTKELEKELNQNINSNKQTKLEKEELQNSLKQTENEQLEIKGKLKELEEKEEEKKQLDGVIKKATKELKKPNDYIPKELKMQYMLRKVFLTLSMLCIFPVLAKLVFLIAQQNYFYNADNIHDFIGLVVAIAPTILQISLFSIFLFQFNKRNQRIEELNELTRGYDTLEGAMKAISIFYGSSILTSTQTKDNIINIINTISKNPLMLSGKNNQGINNQNLHSEAENIAKSMAESGLK